MAIHVIPSTSDGIWTIAGANQYSYAPLYVAATDIGNGNITIDKTNIEIVSAYNIGQEIYCIYKFVNADTEDNMVVILPLSSINIDTETISFVGFYTKEDESIHALELYIDARGRADLYDTTLLTSDDFTAEDREKLDKIGTSSSGVSSWNDLTDKPFGEENGFVDVLPLTKYSGFYLNSTFGLYAFSELPTYELAIGDTYIVNWDGIDYECIAQDASALMSGTVALGNLANFGLSGNNEPFVIGVIAGLGAQYFSLTDTEAGGSHDVRIYQEAIIQKKLDPKYIPIPFFGEIRDTILDCTFTDTQDSDGNWSYQCLYEDTSDSTLTIGEYYTINWNGVKYTCECISALGFPAIGNTVAIGGEDTGLPFAIARDATGSIFGTKAWASMIITPIDNGIYNCTISGDITKKIDTKYLYQPDWDENNKNSGNYIINKPFYSIDAGTVILSETEVNCNMAEDDGYIGIIQGTSFVDGYKYEVIFDDVAYLLTYVSYDVGDGVFETLDGTSRPSHFDLTTSSQFSNALIVFASESGTHTLKITLAEEVIKKLDAKYISEVDGLPEVTVDDNNKILVVTNGAWTVQMPASGLPNVTSNDNGKVLKVNNGTWAVSAETQELPSVTSDDDGKVLIVSGGVWSTQPSAVELPVVTSDDAGKFLRVNSEGIWVAETIQDVSEVGL